MERDLLRGEFPLTPVVITVHSGISIKPDFANLSGYFIGREEYQLSYLHFEFPGLVYVFEVFRQEPFQSGDHRYSFIYCYMKQGQDWKDLRIEEDVEEDVQEDAAR
jgi:hypothetical protein